MERHQNQNAFTWKRMKLIVSITAQYKSVTMMGFKVKEVAENMLTPSTVGFFYFDEKPNSKEITGSLKLASNIPTESTIQDRTRKTTKHAVKLLPSFSLSCDIGEVFTKWWN